MLFESEASSFLSWTRMYVPLIDKIINKDRKVDSYMVKYILQILTNWNLLSGEIVVSVRIIDTFQNIDMCFTDTEFSKEKWNQYISYYLPYAKEMIEKDGAEYNFEEDVLPVLNAVYDKKEEIIKLHDSFLRLMNNIEEKIRQKLQTTIDAVVVFYLGLCNGAGWVVSFSDMPHILLGIEKIIELNWYNENELKGLIYHELGHVWHKQNRTVTFPSLNTSKDKALWQLYSEGIAMYCEQLLCDNDQFYHQNKDGWLNWCNENRILLFEEYIRVIENQESHQKFFGDWCNYLNVSDIGYYLGRELIKIACKTRTRSQILDLSLSEIETILYKCIDR